MSADVFLRSARRPGSARGSRARRAVCALVATLMLGLSQLACSPGYVLRAAWEEARILARRRAIVDILNDPQVDAATRAKLELVVEARGFAARQLDLNAGDSYTSYTDIGRDTLALVLSASPVDRLAAHTWWFPIVGRIPYKGFFSLDAAEKEARSLRERDYDTYLRTTSAFSTLGWLPDPLLSTVLRQDSVGLVETVIHEVTHNTLFVTGQVKFNESFANFTGSVGAIEFFCQQRKNEELCQLASDRWHDRQRLSEFLDRLWTDLEDLYAQGLPVDSVKARRAELLAQSAERYLRDFAPLMRTPGFARYDPTRLNNASLIARHLYYHRLPLFHAIYERGGGLSATIELIATAVSDSSEPWAALESLLHAKENAP
ncbi:MAG: aminopeptidase [Gemmatimonadota bacterium]|nr:MAG: aminopeptidase [Gemmatimonadota bacterium]